LVAAHLGPSKADEEDDTDENYGQGHAKRSPQRLAKRTAGRWIRHRERAGAEGKRNMRR
jgi:hypothetical protein